MTSGAHFLLVGDSTDLSTLQTTVSRLPVNAYGQIFIEVASAQQIRQWDLPDRMSLSWLCRDSASSSLGAVAPRGELVARAVDAWVAEWIPEQHNERQTPYIMWIGCS